MKVIIGFCGMILLGLISLVAFDHYKEVDENSTVDSSQASSQVETPKPTQRKELPPKKATPTSKPPIKKTQ